MKKFVNDMFTGRDNKTADISRVLWAAGVIAFLGLSIFSVIQGQPFLPKDFGEGLGLVLSLGGLGVGIKSHTEPECKKDVE